MLLEWYVDVEEQGLREGRGEGERLPLMSRVWNHQSYRELDRLLGRMRFDAQRLYWHLAETYFRSTQRRVLQCPRCRGVMPSWQSVHFHKHGHSNVAVVPAVVRVRKTGVDDELVNAAVAWLEAEWRGEVFLPDELVAVA